MSFNWKLQQIIKITIPKTTIMFGESLPNINKIGLIIVGTGRGGLKRNESVHG